MKRVDLDRDKAESELTKVINQHINVSTVFKTVSKASIGTNGISIGKIKTKLKSSPTTEAPF
jgi:hypothetical protein